MTSERKTIIPGREEELAEAREGDLIKITVPAHPVSESSFTYYLGNCGGKDIFMSQAKSDCVGDPHLVLIRSSLRKTHNYDRNLGVMLNPSYYDHKPLGPRREEHAKEYWENVSKLEEAGLWEK